MSQSRFSRPPLIEIDDVINHFAETNKSKEIKIIQVGANDGANNDPVHKYIVGYNWQGILLEPQKTVFENELTKTYSGHSNVHLENAAIAEQSGKIPFYSLSFTTARWATGLATFYRPSLESHIESGYVDRKAAKSGDVVPKNKSDYIKTEDVTIASFQELIDKYKFDTVDFLCVDTEGFDFEVLKLFNFEKYLPQVVLFESKNLSNDTFREAKQYLKKYGYRLFCQRGDTIGIQFQYPLGKKLASQWKAFRKKI